MQAKNQLVNCEKVVIGCCGLRAHFLFFEAEVIPKLIKMIKTWRQTWLSTYPSIHPKTFDDIQPQTHFIYSMQAC